MPRPAILALLLMALGTSARAEAKEPASPPGSERADAIFAAAREAFRASDFEGAAELFRRANALRPSANTKFNEAQSWRRAGREALAADAYVEALASEGLDAALDDAGARQLATLRAGLGQIAFSGAPDLRVTVAHAEDAGLPLRMHLTPGDHTVSLRASDGRVQQLAITIEAGSDRTMALALEAAEAPEALARPQPAEPASQAQWIAGWTALGVGVAGGVVAAILGARFSTVLDDYEATGFVDTALEDEALTLRAATNGVAFSAAIVGAAGVVLLLTAPDDSPTTASLVASPTGGALVLRW
jgi:tetratricopeptide (TPR) repeat protein